MTTVDHLFRAARVGWLGAVRWNEPVPLTSPGVYIVSTSVDASAEQGLEICPVNADAIRDLLEVRPEATIDGLPANFESVSRRLSAMWLPLETVIYIGLAGTSVQQRVRQFYRTAIGARAPHAGGWPIKMLNATGGLAVHYGASDNPDGAELAMIDAFVAGVGKASMSHLVDPTTRLPFANLMYPTGRRKQHGFAGVKETRTKEAPAKVDSGTAAQHTPQPTPSLVSTRPSMGGRRTQNVTANDIQTGQIRVPSTTKAIFPSEATIITVDLHGERFNAKWNPKMGPDKERSGIIRIPKSELARLVSVGGPLTVIRREDVFEIR